MLVLTVMGQLRTSLPKPPSDSPGKESANAGLCFLARWDALLLTAGGWGGWCLQFRFMQCSCIHMYPRYWGKSQSIPKYCIPARKSYAHHLCASLWPYPRVAATPLSLHWMTWMTPRLNGPMPRFCLHQLCMSYHVISVISCQKSCIYQLHPPCAILLSLLDRCCATH